MVILALAAPTYNKISGTSSNVEIQNKLAPLNPPLVQNEIRGAKAPIRSF